MNHAMNLIYNVELHMLKTVERWLQKISVFLYISFQKDKSYFFRLKDIAIHNSTGFHLLVSCVNLLQTHWAMLYL